MLDKEPNFTEMAVGTSLQTGKQGFKVRGKGQKMWAKLVGLEMRAFWCEQSSVKGPPGEYDAPSVVSGAT